MASTQLTYIDSGDGFMFAAFDSPDPGRSRKVPVLLSSPWGWPEMASYRSRRDWGRMLADEGHPVMRVDLPGIGNGSGAARDLGLHAAWVEGLVLAAELLRERTGAPRIAALGLDVGGLLALEAIDAGAPIDELACWATPASGSAFVRETRAFSRMQTWYGDEEGGSPLPEGWLEAGGFVLAGDAADALRGLDPAALKVSATLRRVLLLGRGGAEPSRPLREALEAAGVAVTVGEGEGWDRLVLNPAKSKLAPEVVGAVARWLDAGEAGREASGAEAPATAPRESVEFGPAGGEVRESFFSYPLPAGRGFGVMTEPVAGAPTGVCGVLLNAAADRHVGPNRMWVDAGRELAGLGITTVRVDVEGIGESDGDGGRFFDEGELFAPEFQAQITALLDQLERDGRGTRFLLVGVSSGGFWAYRTALEDPRVVSALLLNAVVFRWRPNLFMERFDHGFRDLLRPDLWMRLLRGRLSWAKVKELSRLLLDRARGYARRLLPGGGSAGEEPPLEGGRDPVLEAEFDRLQAAGKDITIAFTENEPLLHESRSTMDELERWPALSLAMLPGDSHALAPTTAQDAARALIVEQFRRLP